MVKKEDSKTFIITFIFLALGFVMKDLTSLETSITKDILFGVCLSIALSLPLTLYIKKEISEYLILFESLVFVFLSAFYMSNYLIFLEIAFILFVMSIFVFIFLESSYFLKYKMIKKFENNL